MNPIAVNTQVIAIASVQTLSSAWTREQRVSEGVQPPVIGKRRPQSVSKSDSSRSSKGQSMKSPATRPSASGSETARITGPSESPDLRPSLRAATPISASPSKATPLAQNTNSSSGEVLTNRARAS